MINGGTFTRRTHAAGHRRTKLSEVLLYKMNVMCTQKSSARSGCSVQNVVNLLAANDQQQ